MKISPYPVSIGKMGEIRLLVRKEDIKMARNVLKIMNETTEKENNDNRNTEEE